MPDNDKSAASDHSASNAPETRREAEEQDTTKDTRLIPGGRCGASAEIGMSAMDRKDVPSEALDTGQTRYGETPRGEE